MPSWLEAHGEDYDVPAEIIQLTLEDLAKDLSWKNDTCPCFGFCQPDFRVAVCIWVEHPDVSKQRRSQLEILRRAL